VTCPAQLGVVPNADGSAVLQRGKTRVVVGVKAEFASATSAEARRRFFDGTVTCSSTASPMLEGRAGEAVSAELTGALNRMLCDRLGVQPPGAAPSGAPPAADAAPQWVLCADSVVLEADGALLDAASLALRAALADTRVPEVGAGAAAPGGGAPRLELLDAPLVPLPGAGDVPVFVTLAQA
jgi:exosome complex component RRP42